MSPGAIIWGCKDGGGIDQLWKQLALSDFIFIITVSL